jgi:hypothetical protein
MPEQIIIAKSHVPGWVKISVAIGICILAFALIRGCQNNNLRVAANLKLDSLISKNKQDSIKMYNDSVDFVNRMEYAEGKLELNYNQYISATDSIHTLVNKLDKLSAKHINIEPKWDTSIMQVPTEYVAECKECYDELPIVKASVKYLTNRFDSLKTSAITKFSIQEQRIKQLNNEKVKLSALFNDCIAAANDQKKKYEPHRKLFFSLSAITQTTIYTIGGGGGFIYMDKKEHLYGGNGYLTNRGPAVTAFIAFPLSLKRR